jgi:hypothetical protein
MVIGGDHDEEDKEIFHYKDRACPVSTVDFDIKMIVISEEL